MKRAARAAELFASSCASWSSVYKAGKGRAMTCRRFRARPIDDHEASVMRCCSEDDVARDIVARREQRSDEASPAELGEGDRFLDVAVRHDRVHGTERFYGMRCIGCEWFLAVEKSRREERSLLLVAGGYVEVLGISEDELRSVLQAVDVVSNVLHLRLADQ